MGPFNALDLENWFDFEVARYHYFITISKWTFAVRYSNINN